MKSLEHWVLRIADNDRAWTGFNWMRPLEQEPIGLGWILFSSLLLSLPGIAVAAGLIYWRLGRAGLKVWLVLFAFAMAIALSLHMLFAHYWNRRAASLNKTGQ